MQISGDYGTQFQLSSWGNSTMIQLRSINCLVTACMSCVQYLEEKDWLGFQICISDCALCRFTTRGAGQDLSCTGRQREVGLCQELSQKRPPCNPFHPNLELGDNFFSCLWAQSLCSLKCHALKLCFGCRFRTVSLIGKAWHRLHKQTSLSPTTTRVCYMRQKLADVRVRLEEMQCEEEGCNKCGFFKAGALADLENQKKLAEVGLEYLMSVEARRSAAKEPRT